MERVNLRGLATEQVNAHNRDLDRWSPLEIVTQMNKEDALGVKAVYAQLPQIAHAVEEIAARGLGDQDGDRDA